MPMTVPFRHAGPALLLGLFANSAAGLSPPVPMVLVGVDTIGSDSPGFSLVSAPTLTPVTGLRLKFEFPVTLQGDELQLIEAGPDGRIDTQDCAEIPSNDDRDVPLAGLRHGSPAIEVAAEFGPATGLPAGSYRFLLCQQIASSTQRRDFAIAETGWLANPNFSSGTSGWRSTGSEAQMSHGSLDADGTTLSGALRVRGAAGGGLVLYNEGCMLLPSKAHRLRLKHQVLQGAVRIAVTVRAGFPGDQGDAPCVGPHVHEHTLSIQPGPAIAFATFDSGQLPPRPAPAAELEIHVFSIGDTPFDVLLDDIGFSSDPASVFVSNFD